MRATTTTQGFAPARRGAVVIIIPPLP